MTDWSAIPEGGRLIHIGPHKTGTTTLQWALHHAREALHEQGVHYAHHRPQAYRPAVALTGLKADPALAKGLKEHAWDLWYE